MAGETGVLFLFALLPVAEEHSHVTGTVTIQVLQMAAQTVLGAERRLQPVIQNYVQVIV